MTDPAGWSAAETSSRGPRRTSAGHRRVARRPRAADRRGGLRRRLLATRPLAARTPDHLGRGARRDRPVLAAAGAPAFVAEGGPDTRGAAGGDHPDGHDRGLPARDERLVDPEDDRRRDEGWTKLRLRTMDRPEPPAIGRAAEPVSSSGATTDPRLARGPARGGPRGLRVPARDRAARRRHGRLLGAAPGRDHRPGLDGAHVHHGRMPGGDPRSANRRRSSSTPWCCPTPTPSSTSAAACRWTARTSTATCSPSATHRGHARGLRGGRPSGPLFVDEPAGYRRTLRFFVEAVDEEYSDEFGGAQMQILGVSTCGKGADTSYHLVYLVGLGDPTSTLPADRFLGTYELTKEDGSWAIGATYVGALHGLAARAGRPVDPDRLRRHPAVGRRGPEPQPTAVREPTDADPRHRLYIARRVARVADDVSCSWASRPRRAHRKGGGPRGRLRAPVQRRQDAGNEGRARRGDGGVEHVVRRARRNVEGRRQPVHAGGQDHRVRRLGQRRRRQRERLLDRDGRTRWTRRSTKAKGCPVLQGGASITVYETFAVMWGGIRRLRARPETEIFAQENAPEPQLPAPHATPRSDRCRWPRPDPSGVRSRTAGTWTRAHRARRRVPARRRRPRARSRSSHPPQRAPVLVVAVHDELGGGVALEVPEPLQPFGCAWACDRRPSTRGRPGRVRRSRRRTARRADARRP